MDKKGWPHLGPCKGKGQRRWPERADKFNGPAAATLTRSPRPSPTPYALSPYSKPTTNPISMAPHSLPGPPNSPPPTVVCSPFPNPSRVKPNARGEIQLPEGNHIGKGLGEKAGDEDERTRNLRTLSGKNPSTGELLGQEILWKLNRGPDL